MATIVKENYLKGLHYLDQKDENISISDLGKIMQVSKPTVNAMVKKLTAKGWVKYEKYKPLKLTDSGRKTAALVIRKHRLTEMFLMHIMSFGWEEVHDIAEEIEHIKSEKFFDRMDEMLGFPTTDPHGSPIPDKEGKITKQDYKPLAYYETGDRVQVKALKESSRDFISFLNRKKLQLDTRLEVKHVEPFDQSMTVVYDNGMEVQLSGSVCSQLLVVVI